MGQYMMSTELSKTTDTEKSILLVEDSEVERKIIANFLVAEGYYVVEAGTGTEALEFARKIAPDIIISDLRMPELSGIELLRIIKDEFENTPFIMISGYGTMDDVIHGLRLGAWDYLTKPIHPIELLRHSLNRVQEKANLLKNISLHRDYLEEQVQKRTSELLSQNQNYEQEIKRRQHMEEQAKSTEEEWRRTVDALPEMIAIIDKNRNIIRTNKALLDFLGKREEEVLGTSCFMCHKNHPCLHKETLKDAKLRTTEIFFEKENRYLELKIVPYSSTHGEWLGSVHIFRDITEQKQQEKERELSQSKALHSQKMESVGQLASGIAHEINTPTQFVSSNLAFFDDAFNDIQASIKNIIKACSEKNVPAEKILAELEDADWDYLQKEIPSALEQSREGLNRVSSIVRAMKEFSHPGSRESQDVDINNVINVTVTVARNEWKYVANLDLDLSPEIPKISCLSDEIGQVILNLLVNAAHAIEEKLGETPEKDKGTIEIKTFFQHPWVVISISDTGSGMPKHIADKIFDPFFTTKSVGKGTGQGLAIAYDVIVNKHNGNIKVSTEPGRGTTFTIELPLKTGEI
jgi:PAS domain S-box-containing protein